MPLTEQNVDTLYSLLGRAVWHVQFVEEALSTLVALRLDIRERNAVSAERALQILVKHRRNTFGTSLRIARDGGVVDGDLLVRLTELKEERDWLVHRSQQDRAQMRDHSARDLLFARLDRLYHMTNELQSAVTNEVVAFVSSLGVDMVAIEAKIAAEVRKIRDDQA